MVALVKKEEGGETAVAAGAAATSTGAVVACAACCVLPVALPALAMGGSAGVLSWLGRGSGLLTWLSAAMLIGAWAYVLLQTRRTGRRPARLTLALLSLSTLFTALSLAWALFHRH